MAFRTIGRCRGTLREPSRRGRPGPGLAALCLAAVAAAALRRSGGVAAFAPARITPRAAPAVQRRAAGSLQLSVGAKEAEKLLGKKLAQGTFNIFASDKSKGVIFLELDDPSSKKETSTTKPEKGEKKPDNLDGKPIADFQLGEVIDGIVKANNDDGVVVDIGCEYDASLSVQRVIAEREKDGRLKKMTELKGLRVIATNPKRTFIRVALDDESATSWAESRTKYEGGRAIAEFQEGEMLDGVVMKSNRFGVFVDVGCEYDAKVGISKKLQSRGEKMGLLKEGAKLKAMRVSSVDLKKMRIEVSIDEGVFAENKEEDGQQKQDSQPDNKDDKE